MFGLRTGGSGKCFTNADLKSTKNKPLFNKTLKDHVIGILAIRYCYCNHFCCTFPCATLHATKVKAILMLLVDLFLQKFKNV